MPGRHMNTIVNIQNQKVIAKITQILADKVHIHHKIRAGKIEEIKSSVRFVKPL